MSPHPAQTWRRLVLDADLGPSAKTVALALSVFANGQGEAWPSRATLAAGAGVSVRTVVRAIRDLERVGLVDVTRYRGRTHTNRYRLVVPLKKRDTRVTYSDAIGLGITLGITPEKVTHATVKGDTRVTRSRKEIEGLARAPTREAAP